MGTRQFFNWFSWIVILVLLAVVSLVDITGARWYSRHVIEPGDFPANYSITREALPWQIYPDIPRTGNATYHRIIVDRDGPAADQQWGHVVTVRYINQEMANLAYEAIRREAEYNQNAQPLPFGERGSQSRPTYRWNSSDILFQRCGVIVHVALEDDTLDLLLRYARHLHDRIELAKCKE